VNDLACEWMSEQEWSSVGIMYYRCCITRKATCH